MKNNLNTNNNNNNKDVTGGAQSNRIELK
jgi:hypothetical protein